MPTAGSTFDPDEPRSSPPDASSVQSPFLRTDSCFSPNAKEIMEITRLIEVYTESISRIDAIIAGSASGADLDTALEERSRLEHLRIHHRSLLSFERRLPRELLEKIMLISAADEPKGSLPTALVVGQVCRRWRQTAITAGRLWSSFVYSTRESDSIRPSLLENVWIPRSGQSALTLRIDTQMVEKSGRLLKALVAVSERWKTADLRLRYCRGVTE